MRMDVDLVSLRGEQRLAARTGYADRMVMKELPGARWSKELAVWHYPAIFGSAIALGEAAKRLGHELWPSEAAAAWVAQESGEWRKLSEMAESVRGDFGGKVVAAGETLPPFLPHQLQCAEWLSSDGAFGGRLDTSETGSGKTRATLRAAWLCWTKGERGILMVSTMASIKYGWEKETNNVAELLELPDGAKWQVFVLRGTVAKRRKIIAEAEAANTEAGGVGVVLLTNHEQLRAHSRLSAYGDIPLNRCLECGGTTDVSVTACHAHEKEFNSLPLLAVVFDEAHRLMNPKAQQTRAGWYVADRSPRVWGLTGTPGSTKAMENTWALLRLVVGPSWPPKSKWTEYFAETGYSVLGFWEVGGLRPEKEAEFRLSYGAVTRRVLKAQVLDLPPLVRGGSLERVIPMGKVQRALYVSMRDDLLFRVKEGTVTAANALVLATRLLQLSSSSGEPGPDYGKIIGTKPNGEPLMDATLKMIAPSNKVDEVVDMITSGDVEPGTVFQFVSSQLLFMTRNAMVEKKAISRADDLGVIAGGVTEAARGLAIDRFQKGKIPYFAFTASAGGAGTTLTRSNLMVAVERPWSPVIWKQAQDRVHRIGSEVHESVSIVDLLSEDTIERHQIESVLGNMEELENIVKDRDKLEAVLS